MPDPLDSITGPTLAVDIRYQSRSPFQLQFAHRFEPGITLISGPSGSGKTTLLKILAGLLKPDAGRIALENTVYDDVATGTHLPPDRRGVGMVFQDDLLFPHLSVKANMVFGMKEDHSANDWSLEQLARQLHIETLLGRKPGQLSGGERQRVAWGRALLASPKLLLLDEPFSALNDALRIEVAQLLNQTLAWRRLPILLVTHQAHWARHFFELPIHRELKLDNGMLILSDDNPSTP